jgi:two-component system, NarL family, response regulator, fimbrial Z protein, FimZ
MCSRILIADNNYIARIGLATILELEAPEAVIDYASDDKEVKKAITAHRYDVVFLDTDIPCLESTDIIPVLKKIQQDIKILIFTDHQLQSIIRFVNSGINGYLHKRSTEKEIRAGFRTILKTGFFFPPEAGTIIAKVFNERRLLQTLSTREHQIFELLAKGKTNIDISVVLNIKPSTVSTFKKKIYKKLNIKNIIELTELYQKLY